MLFPYSFTSLGQLYLPNKQSQYFYSIFTLLSQSHQKWLTVIGKNQMHLTAELKKSFLQVAPAYYFAICLVLLAIGIINLYSQEPIDLPTSKQILLNLLMLQDVMQYSSISAGLWYVIIHLQNIFFSLVLLRL